MIKVYQGDINGDFVAFIADAVNEVLLTENADIDIYIDSNGGETTSADAALQMLSTYCVTAESCINLVAFGALASCALDFFLAAEVKEKTVVAGTIIACHLSTSLLNVRTHNVGSNNTAVRIEAIKERDNKMATNYYSKLLTEDQYRAYLNGNDVYISGRQLESFLEKEQNG